MNDSETFGKTKEGSSKSKEDALRQLSDQYLTPAEAAKLLHVSVNTLAAWRQHDAKHLPFIRVSPHKPGNPYRGPVLYRLKDVLALLDSGLVGAVDRNDVLHGMQKR